MAAPAQARPPIGGDLLVRGGRLFTGTGAVDGDVLVLGGRIAAIGGDAAQRAPASVTELDAAGGLVTSGLGDSHVHPLHAGQTMLTCDLSGISIAGEYLTAIGEYAAAHPDAAWITGAGWSMEAFPGGVPTASALDAVVADRPVYLPNRDGHGVWVNTRALELAGVDDSTPDPRDGRIERDSAGHATGTLHEGAADLVGRLLPPVTDADLDRAFDLAQAQMFAWGITSWQDAIVGATSGGPDLLAPYLRAAGSGRLRAHVVGALWWDRSRGLEQVDELRARRELAVALAEPSRFHATSVKIMQDGVAENFTAAMLEPYLDACGHATSNAGKSFVDPLLLREAVTALHGHGFQVHLHALGDRAVREALDAIEVAQTQPAQTSSAAQTSQTAVGGPGGGADLRHHLAHLQVIHPDDIPRFAALGAVANIQPLWARHEPQMDDLTIPFLGERRASWQYPFAALADAGATLAAGSDWPVSTADVLEGMHTAVNRAGPGEGRPFIADQALSLAQALTSYTEGVAYVNHDEHRTGRLSVGTDGDLTVLDRDLFAAPITEIAHASVAFTVIGGDVVHDATSTAPKGTR